MVFYMDRFERMVGDEIIQTFLYSDVKGTLLSNHLYIILLPHLVYCVVRRDGFSPEGLNAVQKRMEEITHEKDVQKPQSFFIYVLLLN